MLPSQHHITVALARGRPPRPPLEPKAARATHGQDAARVGFLSEKLRSSKGGAARRGRVVTIATNVIVTNVSIKLYPAQWHDMQ